MSEDETDTRVRLMSLMSRHQRQIFGYIYTLVARRADAEDILQETNLVVCKKFDEFKEGTDFVAWACQIAWWNVQRARQKFARAKVVFDDEVLESVAETAVSMVEELDHRHEALAHCLGRLHPRDRVWCSRATSPEAAWRLQRSAAGARWRRLTRR